MDPKVRAVFDAAPASARDGMLALRGLILSVAAGLPEVGAVEDALHWGEPADLTPMTRAGSTIRIGVSKSGGFAVLCNCRISLIADFRDQAGEARRYDGNRAVLFNARAEAKPMLIGTLIARALTWHWRGSNRLGKS